VSPVTKTCIDAGEPAACSQRGDTAKRPAEEEAARKVRRSGCEDVTAG
jgi:hypothetical protein